MGRKPMTEEERKKKFEEEVAKWTVTEIFTNQTTIEECVYKHLKRELYKEIGWS